MPRYQNLNNFDGSITGITPMPAGPYDIVSPGGLAAIQHHWSGGMFGPQERTYDVYAGTGERYIYGEYGNLYRPNSHTDLYKYYRGPASNPTEHTTLLGDPYYWYAQYDDVPVQLPKDGSYNPNEFTNRTRDGGG